MDEKCEAQRAQEVKVASDALLRVGSNQVYRLLTQHKQTGIVGMPARRSADTPTSNFNVCITVSAVERHCRERVVFPSHTLSSALGIATEDYHTKQHVSAPCPTELPE